MCDTYMNYQQIWCASPPEVRAVATATSRAVRGCPSGAPGPDELRWD